jgi:DDE superfamily endonuclease
MSQFSSLQCAAFAINRDFSDSQFFAGGLQLRKWSERRDEAAAAQFVRDVAFLKQDRLIFVDEMGKSGPQLERVYGRGRAGCRPRVYYKRRGKEERRVNAIAAMTSTAVLTLYVHTGTSNADIFVDAVQTMLVSYAHLQLLHCRIR